MWLFTFCRGLLPRILLVILVLAAAASSRAAASAGGSTPDLATALAPDGTLRAGISGAFDASGFCLATAPDGRPVFRPSRVAGTGDERWLDGFGLPGASSTVQAVVCRGTDVYIGGSFAAAGRVPASRVAKWNGSSWSALGMGVNGTVYALALGPGGEVYAGGIFTQAGGVAANGIARWDGVAWTPLGTGIGPAGNARVRTLAISITGEVYAGGDFNQAGSVAVSNVAKWNGSTWSSLGAGFDSSVRALAVAPNGTVYAGGNFGFSGSTATRCVAQWNGTSWASVGPGLGSNSVNALAIAATGEVYAAGQQLVAGGVTANQVVRWNGSSWNPLGGAFSDVGAVALAVAGNGDLYAGGAFASIGGTVVNNAARWNGTAWVPIGAGIGPSTREFVYVLAVNSAGHVYAGGTFTLIGRSGASFVSEWDGTDWLALGDGLDGMVNAVAVGANGDVYVGGSFTRAGTIAAQHIARWDGSTWSALGAGLNDNVYALAVRGNDVYAGGSFTSAGGSLASGLAKWNGTTWSPLGAGVRPGGPITEAIVYALALGSTGDLYVGGSFGVAGGVTSRNLARWDGNSWSALGGEVSGQVKSLLVSGTDLYVGGAFIMITASGTTANNIARWDGTAWSTLGAGTANGVDGSVYALALVGTDVYAGGTFPNAGGSPARYLARWDGISWSSPGGVGNLLGNNVTALATRGTDLYVGGYFAAAGSNIAKWNGSTWSTMGTGTAGRVFALGVNSTGTVFAGGDFLTVGDGSKVMGRFGIYDASRALGSTAATTPAAVTVYPSPTRGHATLCLPAAPQARAVQVLDELGREVQRLLLPAYTSTLLLDLHRLPAGVYSLRCGDHSVRLVLE